MIDERKTAILRAVVTEYIETAQPVGSAHVSYKADVDVSPATVRNEMANLEHEGYLVQPHTSAGRVPTDKGYRYFVDHLAGRGTLGVTQRKEVKEFFAHAHGELEEMLDSTSKLLSRLTDYAAVVVGPAHEGARVRSAQLVSLSPRLVLAVVVLSNGVVEKRSLELAEDTGEEIVSAASALLAREISGRTIPSVGTLHESGDARADSIVEAALEALEAGEESEHVFVGGAARMAEAFDAVDTVRSVLGILEQQYVVVTLLHDVLDRGLSVAIGTEHGVEPLAECSIVVSPYGLEGDERGTIGLFGPTRMNYSQALAAVAVVSQRLGDRLSEG